MDLCVSRDFVRKVEDFPLFCDGCWKIVISIDENHKPRYYNDLFNYLGLMLKLVSEGGQSWPTDDTTELPFVKEFCEAHGFDFDLIEKRLRATGGLYDEGEVMMNSTCLIPIFDKLP